MHLKSKLPNIGTTIFTIMSGLATKTGAINLGQGFPDFAMDEELVELVNRAMQDGHNQYAPMAGHPPLRDTLAHKIDLLYKNKVNPDTEITITPGGTYAIYTSLTTILQPGDEVILFEPAYDSYIPNILINGGVPVSVPLEFPNYSIDWQKVKLAKTKRTKAILLNSPHNPTGAVLSAEDIEELRSFVDGTDIFIISDEVYEHIILDGIPHRSILRYPDLFERSFVCFSLGKVFHCTGWKLGYCVAPAALSREFRKVHQFNAFSCFTPTQVALAEFLKEPAHYLSLLGHDAEEKKLFSELNGYDPLQTPAYPWQLFPDLFLPGNLRPAGCGICQNPGCPARCGRHSRISFLPVRQRRSCTPFLFRQENRNAARRRWRN